MVLTFSTHPNWTLGTSGGPKFSGVSEIGDLRQAKAKTLTNIGCYKSFGKWFLDMHDGYVSCN